MNAVHEVLSAHMADAKARRDLGLSVAAFIPARPGRTLTAAEVEAIERELDELLPECDPGFEAPGADKARRERGKWVADRIALLNWKLTAA